MIVDPPPDIVTRDAGPGQKWYKIQIYTMQPGKYGGTDGHVRFSCYGTLGRIPDGHTNMPGLYLNSPGNSHEQGNYDIYYTCNDNIGEVITADPLRVVGHDEHGLDDWSCVAKLFELDINKRWVLVKDWGVHHHIARDDYWPDKTILTAAVHLVNGQAPLYRNSSDKYRPIYPRGAKLFEIQ